MDARDSTVRKCLAEWADLLGVIQHFAPSNRKLLDLVVPNQDDETVESIPANGHVRKYSYNFVDYRGKSTKH